MKRLNAKGFSGTEAILVIIIFGLIGGVGFYIWSQNKTAHTKESEQLLTSPAKLPEGSKVPENSTHFKDAESGISFYYPKAIEGTFKVVRNKLNEDIAIGFGAPIFQKYAVSTDSWQTYGFGADSTADNLNKVPIKNNFTETKNKVGGKSTIHFNAGEAGTMQHYIAFPAKGSIYKIIFPVLQYSLDSTDGSKSRVEAQDTLQNESVEKLIETIKLD